MFRFWVFLIVFYRFRFFKKLKVLGGFWVFLMTSLNTKAGVTLVWRPEHWFSGDVCALRGLTYPWSFSSINWLPALETKEYQRNKQWIALLWIALGVIFCTQPCPLKKAMHALARAVSRLAAAAYSENVYRECLAEYSNWSPATPVAA